MFLVFQEAYEMMNNVVDNGNGTIVTVVHGKWLQNMIKPS